MKIQWKIDGINTCLKHHIQLISNCHYCFKEILYKDISNIGYCPHCKKDISIGFKTTGSDKDINWNEQSWLHESWTTLFKNIYYKGSLE